MRSRTGKASKMKASVLLKVCSGVVALAVMQANAAATWQYPGNDTIYANPVTSKVGIGNSHPESPLTVGDASANRGVVRIKSYSATYPPALMLHQAAASGRIWALYSGESTIGVSSFGINDLSGGGYRMVINSSGFVGFGKTSPGKKVDISGAVRADTLYAASGTNNARITYTYVSGSYDDLWLHGVVKVHKSIGSGDANAIVVSSGVVQADSGLFTKVKINNKWTLNAPDYVFDKNYKLPSLKAVEQHISANKHLPDLPSAAEMKKNGVDIAEMNMILLKKVEELTLYVIAQQKEIDNLKQSR